MEFIEGATRLRGSAKALDIWRMESKVEMLFEHLCNILKDWPVAAQTPPCKKGVLVEKTTSFGFENWLDVDMP